MTHTIIGIRFISLNVIITSGSKSIQLRYYLRLFNFAEWILALSILYELKAENK